MTTVLKKSLMTWIQIVFVMLLAGEFTWAQKKAAPVWKQQAQALQPGVEIYVSPNFDSEVVQLISPGKYYWITEKPVGPFYTIRLSQNQIGYVPDTELEIKGKGAFQPKPFAGDEEELESPKEEVVKKTEKISRKKTNRDEESEDYSAGQNYFGVSLVNYHENTLGAVQVGDLFALSYKRLPWQTDETAFGMGLLAWDAMFAFSAPAYYEKKTGRSASGWVVWGGLQAQNFSPINSMSQFRYGMGPFVKYSSFSVDSALKKYSLQDLTLGLALEGAFQLTWLDWGLDIGLRYNWDKTPYGSLSIGVLF